MEALYVNQTEIAEALRKLLVNFKKDGEERKTIDYCKRKLELLESYWRDYQVNNEKLGPFETTNHQYFVNTEFERTRDLYLMIKRLIIQCHDNLIQRGKQTAFPHQAQQDVAGPSTSQPQPPSTAVLGVTFESRGSNSKLDDMLHKQSVNFKAFTRAVDSIDVDAIEDKWEFEDALRILQNRWTTIDNLHWEIIGESGEDQAYEYHFTKHEQTFNSMKKAINSKMWSTSHREKSTPKIDIPVFSGNYQHWVSFKDLFSETIHKNTSLSNAQKMQFLKSKVKGEAERLIQHLPISSDNYLVCWEILNHRFENKKLIFTSHVNVFLNLPNIQQQSFPAIKKLHDVTIESLHAIKNLGVDTSTWDPLLVHILSQKLDSESYSEYIESLKNSRELPVLQDFLNFLENKFTSLESSRRRQDMIPKSQHSPLQNNSSTSFSNNRKHNYYKSGDNNYWKQSKSVTKSMHVAAIKCPLCFEEHTLANCDKFNELSNELKLKTVKQLNYCINCIYNHNGNKCHSTKRCRKCTGNHHTVLHDCFTQQKLNFPSGPTKQRANCIKQEENTSQNSVNGAQASQRDASEILLATALVKVTAADSTQHVMRALIDQGSQISLISEKAAQQLGLKRQQFRGVIFGVGERESNCKGMLSIACQSMYTDFKFSTDVLIMNNLLKNLPNRSFVKPSWSHLEHINLADPEFYTSRPVDLLLGADVYAIIMLDGMIKGSYTSSPLAQQTQLGWLLCGSVKTFQCNVVLNNLENIRQFWEIEDIQEQNEISSEDQECVEYYRSSTKRLESGRYEVSLPMKQQLPEKLGSSREIALAQFRNLETKFSKQAYIAQQYKQFLIEYEALGHMKLATLSNNQLECFLPHHAVQRAESDTTKLRVVFNASAKTSSGHSLNDMMHKGPNLQQDLQKLLLQWRQYRYAYTADIEKMYRQIAMRESDQKLQQIFWRERPGQAIRAYQLTTVTYGTKSAPFLALMTLRQLASDEQHNFPKAAFSLREQFYSDDLASGSHSIEEGKQHIAELNSCLSSGGFLLRKWSANEKTLLENIDASEQSKQPLSFTFKSNAAKTLGLLWNPVNDEFTFQYSRLPDTTKLTKRILLSEISKIFDPLGWLAPLTTRMKLLFKKVWLNSQIQWSDEVSTEIKNEWIKLKSDMEGICNFRIPRWLQSKRDDVIQLHGFCDASLKAYACVVYGRVVLANRASVVLVAAKSRLVPSSKVVSLPRLELCAAELLSKLMSKIVSSIESIDHKIYGWCDSEVTLSWIQGNPDRWKPFVSNRVKKITTSMSPEKWHYVATKENPADSASRGLSSSQLMQHDLWWQGPSWLSDRNFEPKSKQVRHTTEEEVRKLTSTVQKCSPANSIVEDLLHRHSSFSKVVRIIAWLLRALAPTSKQRPSYLTLQELRKAKLIIIKYVQLQEFSADIDNLLLKKRNSASKLLNLNPFVDQDGILRVGGRLRSANISADMKYPMIIPYSGRLTELLIHQAHELVFHGGARLTLSLLRQSYWIIKGNRAVKKQLRNCVPCKKQEPRRLQQIMGDLPDFRSNPAPPFYHTGVDYTGFIRIKANKGRGIRTSKGYIALFICMVTKAVHIELVSDLSSSSFIAALRRMAARRGAPKHLYSDNGTNFVGANKGLQEEQQNLQRIFSDTFYKEIAEMGIEWHWNCPSWPSAGGIWERSIRTLKQHLKRVIGDQPLTFEEYTTILAQIEASLNSRPLCPISEDIDDIDFLTPAHFLTSRAGLTVIETAQDARTRWYLTNKIFQDIWKRWKSEYLSQLSVRSKWLKVQNNLEVGDMVTIHDDNLPAGKWPVGRVVEVHPGNDGIVRVETLKTKNGYLKRPVIRLSILPIEIQKESKASMQRSNENKAEKEKSKQTNSRPNILSVALSLLLFINIITSTDASNSFTKFNTSQTLYFDHLGTMHLIRDEWKLVAYYNMSPYWQGDKAVSEFSKYLSQTCGKIQEPSHCHIILLQIQHEFNELQYYNHLLLNQHFVARSRTRRGLINAVGSIANTLFGVLDQEYAEKYKQDIDLVHSNINHLSQLYKNQTSIIEAEYNILKRVESTIEKQHKIINKHLNYLDNVTNKMQKEIDLMSVQQDFTLAALATVNMIQNLKRIQDNLIETMTDIYHGQINLHLLTPKQLSEELLIVSGQISKELALPVDDIQSNLYKIYKLLKIKARITEEYFIFEITLPLISRDTFQLYKLIPVPLQMNRSMISVKPASDYVAINLKRDAYLSASARDLQGCELQEENYLCQLEGPIKHLGPDEGFCETDTPPTCKLSKSSCQNVWIQLRDPSTYLYFCCDSYSLRVICDNAIQTRQLSKAGLIHLSKQCMIKGRDITLYSYQQLHNTVTLEPNIYKTKLTPIQHLVSNSTLHIRKFEEVEHEKIRINDSLKHLGDQIKSMKEAAQQADVLTSHDVHHYVLSYGLLAAAVAAFLWFLWRRGRRAVSSPHQQRNENVPSSVSVCINQPVAEQSSSVSARAPPSSEEGASVCVSAREHNVAKRWSSLRWKKRDVSTSPIAKRQSVFSIDDSTV